jgi:hypothetical protein
VSEEFHPPALSQNRKRLQYHFIAAGRTAGSPELMAEGKVPVGNWNLIVHLVASRFTILANSEYINLRGLHLLYVNSYCMFYPSVERLLRYKFNFTCNRNTIDS